MPRVKRVFPDLPYVTASVDTKIIVTDANDYALGYSHITTLIKTIDSGGLATDGSNNFNGNQTITGSVDITGSLNVNGQPVVVGPLGWARYDDTQYTTSSVFSLTVAAGEQPLPNNGGNTIETHLHSSISFYDSGSNKIQVENEGDTYMCTVVFDAKTSNANGTFIRVQLDNTTGTPYERVGKDLFFGKGNDTWHEFHEVFQWYADEDFVTNGNRWNVQAFGNTVSIANVVFFIQRTQNHKV
jgi:hypothetical protein